MLSAPAKSRLSNHPSGQTHRDERRRQDSDDPKTEPVNAFTMGGIVRDAGLTEEHFRGLL
jgi:hypothetical protein